jgi:putative membrane protein
MAGSATKPAPGSRFETVSAVVDTLGGMVGLARAATSITRKQFVPHAMVATLYEIEAAKIALRRARREDVKACARAMLADHEKMESELRSFIGATNSPQTPPETLDAVHQTLIGNLHGASDADFDKRYIAQQKLAHAETITLFKTYQHTARDDGLRSLIGLALPVLEQHMQMVRELDQSS